MLRNKKFLAIILARGGSKRLPRKNIMNLNGLPLIGYTINAAKKSSYIDKIVVSSDDDEILSISKKFGAQIIKRPNKFATDTSSSFDAIKHVIENVKNYDYILLLQPTSPLRTTKDIDLSIELLFEKKADAIISVCEVEHSPLWTNPIDDSLSMESFINEEAINKRSQDLQKYFRPNGAIYLCDVKRLLKEESFYISSDIYAYKMTRENSIDIDESIDFKLAEVLIKE